MTGLSLLSPAVAMFTLAVSGTALAQSDRNPGQNRSDQQQNKPTAQQYDSQKGQQQARDRQKGGRTAQDQQGDKTQVILLRNWNYDTIYGQGWSAKRLMDRATVYGPAGDDIGSVENIVVNRDGTIAGIIAQVGGFLDIGDTHVFVPWDRVRVSSGLRRVTIPVSEDTAEDFSTWPDAYLRKAETGYTQVVESDLTTGPRIWRATELIGDYSFLTGDVGHGNVHDLIFTDDGKLHAVIVNAYAGYGGGYYAFPYYGYGYGWHPGYAAYYTGYGRNEIADLERFDYRKMNRNVADDQRGQGATTGRATEAQSAPTNLYQSDQVQKKQQKQ